MKKTKKICKIALRVVGILLALAVTYNLFLLGFDYLQRYYGRDYWCDERLSERIELRVYSNGSYNQQVRLYDLERQRYISPRYDWVVTADDNADSLAVFAHKERRGFLNINTGEVVIPAIYDKAWLFSEGMAAVISDGELLFIDHEGHEVLHIGPVWLGERRGNADYLFRGGYCPVSTPEGLYGIINTAGEWVVEPRYAAIWAPTLGGYRVVEGGGRFGILNEKLEWHAPIKYDFITAVPEYNGFEMVADGRMWVEDLEGRVVLPFLYDRTFHLEYPVSCVDEYGNYPLNLSTDYVGYEIMGKKGIMELSTGRPLTPAIYDNVTMLSPDMFEVTDVATGSSYTLTL